MTFFVPVNAYDLIFGSVTPMACECRDDNGELLDICLGVCGTAKIIVKHQEERKMLEEKIDHMSNLVTSKINRLIPELANIINLQWKEGFMEGIKFAVENGLGEKDY